MSPAGGGNEQTLMPAKVHRKLKEMLSTLLLVLF
jgi:hypothetical protein